MVLSGGGPKKKKKKKRWDPLGVGEGLNVKGEGKES